MQEPGGGALFFDSTAHRKLRYYRLLDDGVDADGHGSHCGGSAAGSPQAGGPGARRLSQCVQEMCEMACWTVCISVRTVRPMLGPAGGVKHCQPCCPCC